MLMRTEWLGNDMLLTRHAWLTLFPDRAVLISESYWFHLILSPETKTLSLHSGNLLRNNLLKFLSLWMEPIFSHTVVSGGGREWGGEEKPWFICPYSNPFTVSEIFHVPSPFCDLNVNPFIRNTARMLLPFHSLHVLTQYDTFTFHNLGPVTAHN